MYIYIYIYIYIYTYSYTYNNIPIYISAIAEMKCDTEQTMKLE